MQDIKARNAAIGPDEFQALIDEVRTERRARNAARAPGGDFDRPVGTAIERLPHERGAARVLDAELDMNAIVRLGPRTIAAFQDH